MIVRRNDNAIKYIGKTREKEQTAKNALPRSKLRGINLKQD
jgi:hypothetical protein